VYTESKVIIGPKPDYRFIGKIPIKSQTGRRPVCKTLLTVYFKKINHLKHFFDSDLDHWREAILKNSNSDSSSSGHPRSTCCTMS